MLIALAIALAWLAGGACYLSSEHQRLRSQPWPARPARWLSLAAAVLSVVCWFAVTGVSAAIAAAIVSLCFGLLFWPYAASGVRWLRGGAHVE